jgi:hypothetical protein
MKAALSFLTLLLCSVVSGQSVRPKTTFDYRTPEKQWKLVLIPSDSFLLITEQPLRSDSAGITRTVSIQQDTLVFTIADTLRKRDSAILAELSGREAEIARREDSLKESETIVILREALLQARDTAGQPVLPKGSYLRGDNSGGFFHILLQEDYTYRITDSLPGGETRTETGSWKYQAGSITFRSYAKRANSLARFCANRMLYVRDGFLVGRKKDLHTKDVTYFYSVQEHTN